MRKCFLTGLVVAVICGQLCSDGSGAAQEPRAESTDRIFPDYVRLLKQLGPAFAAHRTEHFALVHCGDGAWAQATGQLLERVHEEFYRAFAPATFALQSVRGPLPWVYFARQSDFTDYAFSADGMDMSWLDSYYSGRTNVVALVKARLTEPSANGPAVAVPASLVQSPDGKWTTDAVQQADATRLTHEAAHQISFNSGLLKRGVMYPLWATEGLATNFEADSSGRFGLGRPNIARCRRMIEARDGGRLLSLDALVTLARVPSADCEMTNDLYAQNWALFAFLFQRHRPALAAYLRSASQLQPGRRDCTAMLNDFQNAFGPIEPLRAEWDKFVSSLSLTEMLAASR